MATEPSDRHVDLCSKSYSSRRGQVEDPETARHAPAHTLDRKNKSKSRCHFPRVGRRRGGSMASPPGPLWFLRQRSSRAGPLCLGSEIRRRHLNAVLPGQGAHRGPPGSEGRRWVRPGEEHGTRETVAPSVGNAAGAAAGSERTGKRLSDV